MAFIVITDKNLKPENIKKGVKILKTVGILDVSINNQDKTVDSSTASQDITADNGYTGLGTVTVNPVTASIDANLIPENIKAGVTILGVEGTYQGE